MENPWCRACAIFVLAHLLNILNKSSDANQSEAERRTLLIKAPARLHSYHVSLCTLLSNGHASWVESMWLGREHAAHGARISTRAWRSLSSPISLLLSAFPLSCQPTREYGSILLVSRVPGWRKCTTRASGWMLSAWQSSHGGRSEHEWPWWERSARSMPEGAVPRRRRRRRSDA